MNLARKLNQQATYWAQTGTDMFGAPTFSAPATLICRWEDSSELFINKKGQEIASRSKVFLAQDIGLEGYLYLGVSAETNPRTLTGESRAHEIMMVKRIPDLRSITTLYVAFL